MIVSLLALTVIAPQIHFGPAVVLGNGKARAYVETDANGKATSVGFTFGEAALSGLQTKKTATNEWFETRLKLPAEAETSPFDHVTIDWNPEGHIPIGVYNVPHFDFHFYLVPDKVLDQITLKGDDMARCQMKPFPEFLPEDYIYAPESETPRMGAHWVDRTTPELNGGRFTSTFIYGSYNGEVIFIEPMVTMKFLKSKKSMISPIKQPKSYTVKDKSFPRSYSIRYESNSKTYWVSLNDLR